MLGIVVGVLIQDHDVRQTEFQQLPYHRIFIMLLLELNAPEHVLETINFQTLTAFWYISAAFCCCDANVGLGVIGSFCLSLQ